MTANHCPPAWAWPPVPITLGEGSEVRPSRLRQPRVAKVVWAGIGEASPQCQLP